MLAFDDTGTGDPLVLIHGWAADRQIWHSVVPLLGERRLIAIDLPGSGATPAASEGFDLDQVARVIWNGLPDVGPLTLVGHSLGGAIALTMAAQEPERTRGLVLCAPGGLREPVHPRLAAPLGAIGALSIDLRRRSLPHAMGSPLGRRLLLGATSAEGDGASEEDLLRMVKASDGATRLRESLESVAQADLRPLLKRAPAQLAVICGGRDRVVQPSTIDVVEQARPDAATVLLPDSGHVPMIEQPELFAATLREVLERFDGAATAPGPSSADR